MGEISDLQGKYCVVARSWQSTICRFSEIETEQRKIRSDKHAPFSGSCRLVCFTSRINVCNDHWPSLWNTVLLGSDMDIDWVNPWDRLGCFVIVFFRFLCLKITRGWRVMNRTVLLQPDLWELKKELFGATVVLSRIRRRRTARLEAVSRTRSVAGTSQSKTGPVLQRKALQGMGIPWEWDSHGMAIQLRNGNGRSDNKHRWRGKLPPNSHWKKIPLIFLTVVDLH